MKERSIKTSAANSGSQQEKESHKSWLEKIGQALVAEITTTAQIIEFLQDAHQRAVIGNDALFMLEGVLKVTEMQVREIMIPRSQMVVLKRDALLEETLHTIISSAHSRFPVIGEDKDDIEGILLAKDLLPYCLDGKKEQLQIRDILRPAVIIPESKRLNVLLKDFRSYRNHIAIVVDEYGGVSGLVTIEDVLEEIVGEIEDEHDIEEEKSITRNNDGSYTINALTPLDEFNDYFSLHLDDPEFETIGGIVMKAFGHLPVKNEKIVIKNMEITVLEADQRRLITLQLRFLS